MNKILKELSLPGNTTRPVVIKRLSGSSSDSDRKLELQLELDIEQAKSNSSKK